LEPIHRQIGTHVPLHLAGQRKVGEEVEKSRPTRVFAQLPAGFRV
jgi:hypothetical protein